VNNYHTLEMLAKLHAQELARECAMAARAAELGRTSGPRYREWLARSLRAFARRIDPSVEPSIVSSAPAGLPRSSRLPA
jgi:hypothetical protein